MSGNADIKSFVMRIQTLETEAADAAEMKRDLYAEAKAAGLDTKALRELVKRLKQDPAERAAFEAVIDEYTHQLEMFQERAA